MGESWVFRVNKIKRNWLYWIERKMEKIHLVQTSSSSGEGNGNPLQHSCLENPMDRGAWWTAVHGGAKSQTRLSNFTFTFHFHALEKGMATHSSVLAWRIPGTGKPGGLLSMGSHRVGHDWSDLAIAIYLCGELHSLLSTSTPTITGSQTSLFYENRVFHISGQKHDPKEYMHFSVSLQHCWW